MFVVAAKDQEPAQGGWLLFGRVREVKDRSQGRETTVWQFPPTAFVPQEIIKP